jgi:hypothetical protein
MLAIATGMEVTVDGADCRRATARGEPGGGDALRKPADEMPAASVILLELQSLPTWFTTVLTPV